MPAQAEHPLHPLLKTIRKMAKLHEGLCIRAAKPFQLTRNEADVLLFLSNNEYLNTAMDIVRYRFISKSLVSKSIDNLVSRGLIEAKTDEEDRRYNHLFITPQAQDAVAALQEAQAKFFHIVGGTITPDEHAVLLQVLQKISNNVDEFL